MSAFLTCCIEASEPFVVPDGTHAAWVGERVALLMGHVDQLRAVLPELKSIDWLLYEDINQLFDAFSADSLLEVIEELELDDRLIGLSHDSEDDQEFGQALAEMYA